MWILAEDLVCVVSDEVVVRFGRGLNDGIFNNFSLVPTWRVDRGGEDNTETVLTLAQDRVFIILVSNARSNINLPFFPVRDHNLVGHPAVVVVLLDMNRISILVVFNCIHDCLQAEEEKRKQVLSGE